MRRPALRLRTPTSRRVVRLRGVPTSSPPLDPRRRGTESSFVSGRESWRSSLAVEEGRGNYFQCYVTLCSLTLAAAHLLRPAPASVSTSVQLSRLRLFATPWTAAHQASLSITKSRSLPKLFSIESVMSSNHLILCLLQTSIFPSIRVFSNDSALRIRWPKYWRFSFNISPSNEHPGLISFRLNWLDILAVSGTLKVVFSNTTVQKHQFFGAQLSL